MATTPKTVQANAQGNAPKGTNIGDTVTTKGGTYKVVAEGTKEAAEINAETERLVAEIYAKAQKENMELFKFILELDTVLNSVDENTTLIVKKGEFLDGLFSKELLDMVAEAQKNNDAIDSTGGAAAGE